MNKAQLKELIKEVLKDTLSKDIDAHKSLKNLKENEHVHDEFEMRNLASKLKFERYRLKPHVRNVSVSDTDRPVQIALYNGELGKELRFMSSWGVEHLLQKGDYLVKNPDYKSFYRISAKDLEDNYKKY